MSDAAAGGASQAGGEQLGCGSDQFLVGKGLRLQVEHRPGEVSCVFLAIGQFDEPLNHPRLPNVTGSAIENEPAQLVAQPLVVEHEIPNLKGQLGTLPLAL